MQSRIKPDKGAQFIINRLYDRGFKAYCVGGFVRDSLLNIKSSDIDITSQASPKEVKEIFSDCKLVDISEKYGTIVIIVDGKAYEVTSHRTEGDYHDGRRPGKVTFGTDLRADLERRDFTINALAYSEQGGLVDYFGGVKDLQDKILRAVGDPFKRIDEDYLRMLRAVRFSAGLDLDMEENLKQAIRKKAENIRYISAERINAELSKMLLQDKPSRAIVCLYENRLLKYIIEDLNDSYGFSQENIHHKYDLFQHTMRVLDETPKDLEIRLAALFHDLGKIYTKRIGPDGQAHFYGHDKKSEDLCLGYLTELRYDKKTIQNVCILVRRHMEAMNPYTERTVKRLVRKIGPDLARKLFYLQRADILATSNPEFTSNVDKALEILDYILQEDEPIYRKQLAINGNDIISLGYKQGRQVGKILEAITDLVDEGRLENDRENILKYIEKRSINNEEDNFIRYMP